LVFSNIATAATAQPSISPDGKSIAFLSGGNLWEVSADGGDAHLLVSSAGDVARPLYSPDGKQLAFVSNRTGGADIYLVTLETGALKQLTVDDAADNLDAWSADSKWIYFSTGGHDVGAMQDIYRVATTGGTPMRVVAETYVNEFESAPNPDGHSIAFVENGFAARQWWRNGHSHLDESELWLTGLDSPGRFIRLSDFGAKNQWPMWSPDGKTLYFMSDRDGFQNLWSMTIPAPVLRYAEEPGRAPADPAVRSTSQPASEDSVPTAKQLTHFHDDRVIWPTISADGKTIVFERAFGIWKFDIATGQAAPVTIHLRGTVAGPTVEHANYTSGFWELAVSHDGKKLAIVSRGQIYAATASGGNAFRVTHTDAIDYGVTWAHDDKRIAYISTRDGTRHIYLYDFETKTETRLTNTGQNDTRPMFSPDDSQLIFVRDYHELRSLSLKDHRDQIIARGLVFTRPPFDTESTPIAFSPTGDWLACVSPGPKGFRNVYLCPTTGNAVPRQVSFLPNAQSNSVAWAPDGSALFFGSGQRTEDFQLARVDLTPRQPKFREDQFDELFKEHPSSPRQERSPRRPTVRPAVDSPPTTMPTMAATTRSTTQPPAPAKTQIVFDGIDQRLSLLPVGVDVDNLTIAPDSKAVAFIGTSASRTNVYLYSIDPLFPSPLPRQMTATGGDKECLQFAPDPAGNGNLRLYFLDDGAVKFVNVTPAPVDIQSINVTTEMDIDFDHDKMLMFDEAWRTLNESYADPKMNGVDWNAVRARYTPQIAGAKTLTEVRRLLAMMVGELNSSHMRVDGPRTDSAPIGTICADFDRTAYETSGLLKIDSVVPFGSAALAGLVPGQFILAVDKTPITRETNWNALLEHKVDKDITLSIASKADGSDRHDVKVQTTSMNAERTLRYRAWVEANRKYILAKSNGRLGYVHLADMSQQELTRLYTDLDARNETLDGVVIDVRNNTGGFVNGYAIDVFARKNYITLQGRGFPRIAGRAALGQRFLGLPTILVTNRGTLSDGEDFTEGYQSLGLGDTVGEPTGGWIIFTNSMKLIDGTTIGLPIEKVFAADGTPMEMHPRPVTFAVTRNAGEATAGIDSQLDVAVRELLNKVDKKL
jgi:Tol biopolymer transport system component/C-terminal processing protease CtpA/Prc